MWLQTTKTWNTSLLQRSLPDAKPDGPNIFLSSTWLSVSVLENWELNPMPSLDVGTSIAKGEIATLSSQTRAISDPYSHRNNLLRHYAQRTSQLRLSAPQLSWMSRNSTTTFVYPYPLTPSPWHTYQP